MESPITLNTNDRTNPNGNNNANDYKSVNIPNMHDNQLNDFNVPNKATIPCLKNSINDRVPNNPVHNAEIDLLQIEDDDEVNFDVNGTKALFNKVEASFDNMNANLKVVSTKMGAETFINYLLYPPIELDSKRKVLWSSHDFPENGVFYLKVIKVPLQYSEHCKNKYSNKAPFLLLDQQIQKLDMDAIIMFLIYSVNTLAVHFIFQLHLIITLIFVFC